MQTDAAATLAVPTVPTSTNGNGTVRRSDAAWFPAVLAEDHFTPASRLNAAQPR